MDKEVLKFQAEVSNFMKLGFNEGQAELFASYKLEDKTLFNSKMKMLNMQNEFLKEEMEKKGFKPVSVMQSKEEKSVIVPHTPWYVALYTVITNFIYRYFSR
jgi:hypothetical protein